MVMRASNRDHVHASDQHSSSTARNMNIQHCRTHIQLQRYRALYKRKYSDSCVSMLKHLCLNELGTISQTARDILFGIRNTDIWIFECIWRIDVEDPRRYSRQRLALRSRAITSTATFWSTRRYQICWKDIDSGEKVSQNCISPVEHWSKCLLGHRNRKQTARAKTVFIEYWHLLEELHVGRPAAAMPLDIPILRHNKNHFQH